MASLLSEILLKPLKSPTKYFYQFVITQKEIIWRWWKISVRTEFREALPGEIKQLQCKDPQLAAGFGTRILEYSLALCRGHFDYLECLPDKLLLKILSYISLQDKPQLCNSEEIWKQAVLGHCDVINEDMEMLAKVMGWKNIFFKVCHNKEHDSMACPAEEEDQANAEYPYELLKTTFSQSTRKSYDLSVY
uniref:F-box domain-containing protein n=1 Tax=Sinocyclocheilus anshuiensis TaxID=1608454 RepID=A0A671LMI1_9TELE